MLKAADHCRSRGLCWSHVEFAHGKSMHHHSNNKLCNLCAHVPATWFSKLKPSLGFVFYDMHQIAACLALLFPKWRRKSLVFGLRVLLHDQTQPEKFTPTGMQLILGGCNDLWHNESGIRQSVERIKDLIVTRIGLRRICRHAVMVGCNVVWNARDAASRKAGEGHASLDALNFLHSFRQISAMGSIKAGKVSSATLTVKS